ncbi:Gfo/Idh/MocA family oxidoreductase [Roseiconus nitratireducens]|uniref:Gfo/Idh/MocA family oxidoreductase n=1 Tax=Roseiconus nitratireducens TaxID=2605748 RepID=A0A5M6D9E8_9BACT|nr:Gfo/Idh/MocA family oxidoreductase [Roseiconus nitratireducens]KAA5541825.1 Gfo/Idh/MocA family oxidoreductase [Roseiconus nitratireducens]
MGNLKLNRRSFVRRSAAAATATAATLSAPAILRGRNLNDKLNVAVIGAGGRGARNSQSVESENIVALCDVNRTNLAAAAHRYPGARTEVDFRRLFDRSNEFDAVIVSTCEHTHAFATLPALQLGKHVYCEKPLTYNVEEARVIRMAARDAGVATQMGTQMHASDNYRRVVELIRSGAIGRVREVHVWVSRAWGWHPTESAAREAKDRYVILGKPSVDPVPKNLDWDLWLGPVPDRPFSNDFFPGPKWYRWWEFGNGTMSDLGSHWIDLPFWALELNAPKTIQARGPQPHPEIAPASMQVTYQYESGGDRTPLQLTWYQGLEKPDRWKRGEIPKWSDGHLFVGDEGMLLSDYRKHVLLPEQKFVDFQGPDPFLPRSQSHHQDWIDACKGGPATLSNFEYAGLLTEANHLGNVAYRAGGELHWDTESMSASGTERDPEPFLKRQYRAGWTL